MAKMLRGAPNPRVANERGQVLILVLILLLLGSLLIPALLNFIGTGLKAGAVYEKKTDDLYAADAGIDDAKWQIKYDYLETLFTDPVYSVYDFTTAWTYALSEPVNDKGVNVTIENIWMPKYVAVPSPTEAKAIIEASKLVVTGTVNGTSNYVIRVTYYPEDEEDLRVESLGVWLPPGFSYVAGSSNLETDPGAEYYSVPAVEPHNSNQAVLWNFDSVPFTEFPGVDPQMSPMTAEVTFQFDSSQSVEPDAIAWITTSGVADIPFSWDADTNIYKITSEAASTTTEAYIAKNETRELRSGIYGDYKAVGNSLMVDLDLNPYYRETLLPESSATVNDIPSDATVKAAYLYWSARREGPFLDTCSNFTNWDAGSAWSTSGGKFKGHYNSGGNESTKYLTKKTSLNLSSYASGTVSIYFTLSTAGTLTANDGLDFAFSADGGISWSSNYQVFRGPGIPPSEFTYTIPDAYITNYFKIRFYLVGFGGSGQYLYIDNILVMAPDRIITFKIDGQQVYFTDDGTPLQGAQGLSASKLQVLPNYIGTSLDGYSYVGFRDVTALVKAFSAKAPDPAINHPGNSTYTVAGVAGDTGSQLSYAGWSLMIIYTSTQTAGHSLYLYDTFMHANGNTDIDFDNDGQPGGTISGFIVPDKIEGEVNAAKLTAFVGEGDSMYTGDFLAFNAPESYLTHPQDIPNAYKLWDGTNSTNNSSSNPNSVWNGKSVGLTAAGVDIDTFYITWESGLLQPGDTSARIDVPTGTDEWNLVYIILSFRSESVTGGALSYLIWE